MIGSAVLRPVLRTLAILVALGAAIDPAVTSNRTDRPTIAVTTSASNDSLLAERVSRALSKDFTVARAPLAAAAGTVLVGDGMPSGASELASPVFAVHSDGGGDATISIVDVRAPLVAAPSSRVPIATTARVAHARGRKLDVVLRAGGLLVDRASRTIDSDDARVVVPLAFVPTAEGPSRLQVTASISGSASSAESDALVDAPNKRWSVLFYDSRPSWMSTFVRRAIERDARFVVTSRVVTSRNVSTDAGRPPTQLSDLVAMKSFDAVVVGAPDALSEADVNGLDAYLRRRGGGVTLLLDQNAPGPYERLVNVGSLVASTDSAVVSIALDARDSVALQASEIVWPRQLPAQADVVARTMTNSKTPQPSRPIIWRSPVGTGRLVVCGALDAWRYRDRSRFDEVWRTLISESANASPPPLEVRLGNALPAPGERVDVDVTIRDAALQEPFVGRPVRTSVSAVLLADDSATDSNIIHLLPAGDIGHLRGAVRMPTRPGSYRMKVSADGNETTTPLIVTSDASYPTSDDGDLVAAWVGAHGGRAIPSTSLAELPGELRRAIHPAPHLETWHPMRSAWWIVPFAIFLSAEWWLRRKRGLA